MELRKQDQMPPELLEVKGLAQGPNNDIILPTIGLEPETLRSPKSSVTLKLNQLSSETKI